MIVTRRDFHPTLDKLSKTGVYGLDTESTGLRESDRLFSIIIADPDESYYFNFNIEAGLPLERQLPRCWLYAFKRVFDNKDSLFAIHNAKFDLRMLSYEGLTIQGQVHCTEAMARVVQNNHLGHKPYSLASCAKRIGLAKDGTVDAYIKAHKLYTKLQIPGKEKEIELRHYDQVPYDLMSKYAMHDAKLHLALYQHQAEALAKRDAELPVNAKNSEELVANEMALTKVCFRMERRGIRIDRSFTAEALADTQQAAASAMARFQAMTGLPYSDSPTVLKEAFLKAGHELPLTATGKPSSRKEVLDGLESPLADLVREIRSNLKLISTYYANFLYFADAQGIIRAGIRQGGTETHRFSYGEPNLQNLPKEDEEEDRDKRILVRRCFIPRADFCLVPIDYEQQEFKIMLDYAGQHDMIEQVKAGKDVHQATADMIGVKRKTAKTLNFGLLYGMGTLKLAKALKIPVGEAVELRARYFSYLPKVSWLLKTVAANGKARGYITNWMGFRCHLSNPEWSYVLPNHLIQGGGAEVLRLAMVRIDDYLQAGKLKSGMLAQVHDELLFEVHKDELHHVPEFKRIMESVYRPWNGLNLTCSVEHSWKSWAKWDQVKGLPTLRGFPGHLSDDRDRILPPPNPELGSDRPALHPGGGASDGGSPARALA